MPSFKAEVPHELGREEAVGRLQGLTDKIRERYQDQVSDLEHSWADDGRFYFSFSTFGFSISGTVDVQDDLVRLNGHLPFAAVVFRGKIEQEVRQQLSKLLT